MEYDLAGRLLGRVGSGDTDTARAYEEFTGRLSAQTHSASASVLAGFDYQYTGRGNIATIAETGDTTQAKTYSYDALERLNTVVSTDATDNPGANENYTLDAEGNRTASHLSASYSTDAANRLLSDDDYTYSYDANGNLVSKTPVGAGLPAWGYVYDGLDGLIEVSRDGAVVERYRFDALGRRSVIETANDADGFVRTAIVHDGQDRVLDLGQNGTGTTLPMRRYTHGENVDEPLSMEVFEDGVRTDSLTYHTNHLGSVRYLTDSAGTLVNAYDYDSYGRLALSAETITQPFAYTGREWNDATGLYHYRARSYGPATGRFMQEDPIGFAAGDCNTQNEPLRLSFLKEKSIIYYIEFNNICSRT